LFPYFDLMSRMAVWKERRRLMDSDELSLKVMGWDQRFWAGSDQMR
jgi:hypothetical protein